MYYNYRSKYGTLHCDFEFNSYPLHSSFKHTQEVALQINNRNVQQIDKSSKIILHLKHTHR